MTPAIGDHKCNWPGCQVHVRRTLWGCTRHWLQLPAIMRAAIWRHQSEPKGQDYRKACQAAERWAMGYEMALRDAVKRDCERPLDA